MSEDAIIKNLREIKEKNAEKHEYDIAKMVSSLRKQQDQGGAKGRLSEAEVYPGRRDCIRIIVT